MFRAAAWTGGLFAVAGGIVHFFPGQFTEPLVLLALGATLLLVGSRRRVVPTVEDDASEPERVAETRAIRP